ncbi:hypothetical protein EVAR_72305_1 [Eumeta japonica]|uniref:Uncharacterized protein n=1 Tax=Eumeta variegata TaxID=151549 RepID=A0A4C1TJ25_EUMVA|nr:hypothetical protein EVAR_72305_1 [Eumeta japonica]
MLKYLSILLIQLIVCLHLINCQIPFPGTCPDVKIVESFDLDRNQQITVLLVLPKLLPGQLAVAFRNQLLWILTRERQPTEEVVTAAKEIIKQNQLSETFLIKSTQTDCPDINDNPDNDQAAEASSSSTDGSDSSIDFAATSTERIIETA